MSTQIAEINGTDKSVLQINQFYGGKKHGLSLQFTAIGGPEQRCSPLNSRYVQINSEQVRDLISVLRNWLGENELPAPIGDGISVFEDDMENDRKIEDQWEKEAGQGVFSDDY